MEWKLVRDDLHRLRQELAERSVRLAALRAKHATLLSKHGGSAEEAQESEVRNVPSVACMLSSVVSERGPARWARLQVALAQACCHMQRDLCQNDRQQLRLQQPAAEDLACSLSCAALGASTGSPLTRRTARAGAPADQGGSGTRGDPAAAGAAAAQDRAGGARAGRPGRRAGQAGRQQPVPRRKREVPLHLSPSAVPLPAMLKRPAAPAGAWPARKPPCTLTGACLPAAGSAGEAGTPCSSAAG